MSITSELDSRSDVIRNRIHLRTPVIPAKAGIQSVVGTFPMAREVNSCFRWNDGMAEFQFLANDAATVDSKLTRPPKLPERSADENSNNLAAVFGRRGRSAQGLGRADRFVDDVLDEIRIERFPRQGFSRRDELWGGIRRRHGEARCEAPARSVHTHCHGDSRQRVINRMPDAVLFVRSAPAATRGGDRHCRHNFVARFRQADDRLETRGAAH